MDSRQFTDPTVSKVKFDEELNTFLKGYDIQRRRGITLLKSEFPDLYFSFSATALNPSPIVFAVRINFDNYDLVPLSISFVNPFTFERVKIHQVITHFNRATGLPGQLIQQPLLQQEQNAEAYPFLCIPGVREYHDHPAHSGDSWLLHRKISGEGSLGYLLDKLYQYGISAIVSYNIGLNADGFQFQMAASQLMLGNDPFKIPS